MSTASTTPFDLRRLRYDEVMKHEIDCLSPRDSTAPLLHLLFAFHSRVPDLPRVIEDFRLGHIGLQGLTDALRPHQSEFVNLVRCVYDRYQPDSE